MAQLTMLEAVRAALRQELARDPLVLVLGEDVGRKGGVFLATEGLQAEFGPERVIDTPLSETLIGGLAVGAALGGCRPVAEIQFADYIYPAIDHIINEMARIRYRSNGVYACPVVVRAPFGGPVRGGLYHSQSVEQFFTPAPGLKVVIPSTPYDAKGLLTAAIRDDDPVIFFEHKRGYRARREEVPEDAYTVPIGVAAVRREGRHLAVFSYGEIVHRCLEAAERLSREDGIEAEVIDLRTLRPLDEATILAAVAKTGRALIVHEANRAFGVGAEVAALIGEQAFEQLDAPITRLAGPDVPAMPYAHHFEQWFVISTDQIADAMRRLAAY